MKEDNLLKEELESIFKDISVAIPEANKITITANKEQVLTILKFLQDRGYDHLALISCVDWLEEGALELAYIITSYDLRTSENQSTKKSVTIILKTRIDRENPQFVTVIPVFENAEPYEREIHELFGINFVGHPRLTPLFLERQYKIPPFRKNFDTRKYVKEVFDKIPFVEEK